MMDDGSLTLGSYGDDEEDDFDEEFEEDDGFDDDYDDEAPRLWRKG